MFGEVSPLICRLSSSGEGIPGVGVVPFFGPFFISSALGIPGVGVAPLGMFAITTGIPGAPTFVATGAALIPGGKLALSSFTSLAAEVLELAFGVAPPPHARAIAVAMNNVSNAIIRII